MRKRTLLLVLLLAMLCIGANAEEIKLTDFEGREVTLSKPAERIIVLMPGDCEILYALGAGDKLIGRGEYCNYPEEVLSVEAVKSGAEMNLEQVIELKPDLIIATKMAHTKESIEALDKAGIPSLVIDAQNIEGVYKAINLIGAACGKNEEAAKLIDDMKAGFKEVVDKVDGRSYGTVYFEVSPLQYGLWASGGGSFMDEIGNMLGLENVSASEGAWTQVSEEQVIAKNPDVIVTNAMYFGDGPTPIEEIMSRKGWENIKAIENGDVYNADTDSITRPGPRLIDAINDFYNFLYEEEAADKAA